MKKIIALAIAIIMMAAIAIPAFATDNTLAQNGANSSTADVTYGVDQLYTVIVPGAIGFGTASTQTAVVKAYNVIIPGNLQLQVSIASAESYDFDKEGAQEPEEKDAWTMVEASQNGSAPVEYEVALTEGGTALENNDVVLYVNSTEVSSANVDDAKTQTLYFSTDGTTESGNFIDVLTFSVALSTNKIVPEN